MPTNRSLYRTRRSTSRPSTRAANRSSARRSANKGVMRAWPLAFALYIVLLFAMGGSARGDVPFLAGLRIVSLIAIAACIWFMDSEHWRRARVLVIFLLAYLALTLVHFVPLPPAVWMALPHDPLVDEIAVGAGLTAYWRPLTISAPDTLNAALATFPVLALVLLAAMQPKNAIPAIPLVLGIAMASVFLGLMQISGSPNSPLYFYRYFNGGYPIGFFANRNHQAVFLAACLPMTVAFALQQEGRLTATVRAVLAAAAAVTILGTIAVLGSRAGVLTAVIGLAAAGAMLWRHGGLPEQLRTRKIALAGAAGGVAMLAGLAIGFSRSETAERLADNGDMSSELRVQLLDPLIRLTGEYFPFGSGIGSFVQTYRAREPDELLRPGYVNHAHNDWLEWALTGGVPLLLLVLAAAFMILRLAPAIIREQQPSPTVLRAQCGLAFCAILAIASLFDYPLRTPALAGLFALATLWLNDFALRGQRPAAQRYPNKGSGQNV